MSDQNQYSTRVTLFTTWELHGVNPMFFLIIIMIHFF